MDIPIFKYYDTFQAFQRISCASNEDIVTIKEKLLDRAKRYQKEIEEEIPNIKRIKQIMDDYIDGKQPGIKIVLLQDFSNALGTIIKNYEVENSNFEIKETFAQ